MPKDAKRVKGHENDDIQYHGQTDLPEGTGTIDSHPTDFQPPQVPRNGEGGPSTSVDTPSMDLFANNIDLLIAPAREAQGLLEKVSVAPGAFYHANLIRTNVNGANSDGGLKEQMLSVLDDVISGLSDLHAGVHTLSTKYTSIEDVNGMKSTDLFDAISDAQGDFDALIKDAGGSPSGSGSAPSTGSGSAPDSGSGSGDGSGSGSGSTSGNGSGSGDGSSTNA